MTDSWRSKVAITEGDITECDADAIVNAANNDLQLGGGVAGAIRRKGGPEIQRECDRIGRIALGEAVVTTGGRLNARFVIHAASMRLGGRTTEDNLRASTRNSLARAAERGLESIAFPAIGTGVAGFSLERCAEAMFDEVRRHLEGGSSLKRVQFALFGRAAYETFVRVFRAMDAPC